MKITKICCDWREEEYTGEEWANESDKVISREVKIAGLFKGKYDDGVIPLSGDYCGAYCYAQAVANAIESSLENLSIYCASSKKECCCNEN